MSQERSIERLNMTSRGGMVKPRGGSKMNAGVIGTGTVILPPKVSKEDLKSPMFRWHPDTVARIKRIAEMQGYSVNEAGEMLMRWAIEATEKELGLAGKLEAVEQDGHAPD